MPEAMDSSSFGTATRKANRLPEFCGRVPAKESFRRKKNAESKDSAFGKLSYRFMRQSILVTVATATAAAAVREGTLWWAIFTWASLGHSDCTTTDLGAVKIAHCSAAFGHIAESDESKATGLAGSAIHHDFDVSDVADAFKCSAEVVFRSLEGKISYVESHMS